AEAVLLAARRDVSRAALFLIKDGALTGWKSAGMEHAARGIGGISISLGSPGIFKAVVEDKVFYKGPIPSAPQNDALLESFGGARPLDVLACPLVIKDKVVAVLYGDNGGGSTVGDVKRLKALMTKASMALEILILKTKILSDD
ncbi:MAG: hypothetical protein ABSG42_07880, partial [Nitrospirota bacterium]